MKKLWTYALSIVGYLAIAYGIGHVVGASVNAYMVGITGAHPGDPIFLDELASPLSESLLWVAYGLAFIGGGLWATAYARRQRRQNLWTGCSVSIHRGLEVLFWVAALVALLHFLLILSAPESCLDMHGSFDYQSWECSDKNHEYLPVPFWHHTAFWLLAGVLASALIFSLYRRLPRGSLKT